MSILWTIIIGFIAGVIAKFIMPGDNEPAGFVLTAILGIVGAFVASLALGLIRSFGSLGFPLFTDGLMYLFMVIVLIAKPTGLFGKEIA